MRYAKRITISLGQDLVTARAINDSFMEHASATSAARNSFLRVALLVEMADRALSLSENQPTPNLL